MYNGFKFNNNVVVIIPDHQNFRLLPDFRLLRFSNSKIPKSLDAIRHSSVENEVWKELWLTHCWLAFNKMVNQWASFSKRTTASLMISPHKYVQYIDRGARQLIVYSVVWLSAQICSSHTALLAGPCLFCDDSWWGHDKVMEKKQPQQRPLLRGHVQ